jgi:hypothetical protein
MKPDISFATKTGHFNLLPTQELERRWVTREALSGAVWRLCLGQWKFH